MACDVQAALARYLREQAEWRDSLARHGHAEERNLRSKEGLYDLVAYVEGLGAEDERLGTLRSLGLVVGGRFFATESCGEVARSYHYDDPDETPDAWFSRFVNACIEDAS